MVLIKDKRDAQLYKRFKELRRERGSHTFSSSYSPPWLNQFLKFALGLSSKYLLLGFFCWVLLAALGISLLYFAAGCVNSNDSSGGFLSLYLLDVFLLVTSHVLDGPTASAVRQDGGYCSAITALATLIGFFSDVVVIGLFLSRITTPIAKMLVSDAAVVIMRDTEVFLQFRFVSADGHMYKDVRVEAFAYATVQSFEGERYCRIRELTTDSLQDAGWRPCSVQHLIDSQSPLFGVDFRDFYGVVDVQITAFDVQLQTRVMGTAVYTRFDIHVAHTFIDCSCSSSNSSSSDNSSGNDTLDGISSRSNSSSKSSSKSISSRIVKLLWNPFSSKRKERRLQDALLLHTSATATDTAVISGGGGSNRLRRNAAAATTTAVTAAATHRNGGGVAVAELLQSLPLLPLHFDLDLLSQVRPVNDSHSLQLKTELFARRRMVLAAMRAQKEQQQQQQQRQQQRSLLMKVSPAAVATADEDEKENSSAVIDLEAAENNENGSNSSISDSNSDDGNSKIDGDDFNIFGTDNAQQQQMQQQLLQLQQSPRTIATITTASSRRQQQRQRQQQRLVPGSGIVDRFGRRRSSAVHFLQGSISLSEHNHSSNGSNGDGNINDYDNSIGRSIIKEKREHKSAVAATTVSDTTAATASTATATTAVVGSRNRSQQQSLSRVLPVASDLLDDVANDSSPTAAAGCRSSSYTVTASAAATASAVARNSDELSPRIGNENAVQLYADFEAAEAHD